MTRLQSFLQQKRIALGMTQIEAAKKLGLKTTQQLANIEGGRAPFPPRHMKKLSTVLKIRLGDIVVMCVEDFTDRLLEEIKGGR